METHVTDEDRCQKATEALHMLMQESESLDEKTAQIAEEMTSVHLSHSSTTADYSNLALQSEKAFGDLIKASLKTRVILKENVSRKEWSLIFPKKVSTTGFITGSNSDAHSVQE